ncbi:MAG TPA: ELWxxDGT repeat protein [Thermoanaerobaculia bacterium]|jgi:ELWxxDGT repeat protein|nr:ELWxxDGT repeat protein [Thermoanaerobaculia bacterium]
MRFSFVAALLSLCVVVPAVPAAAEPAHLVADLNPGIVPGSVDDFTSFHSFTRLGDRVVFLGYLSTDVQCGLWVTDGTAAGTERLADLCAESLTPFESSFRVKILGVAGPLAFVLDSAARLWRTDGTAAGTFPLGATLSLAGGESLMGPGGILYFASCDAAGHCEPWRSDGTVAGTRLLRAVQAGAREIDFLLFAADGNRVVFSGAGAGGPALWITDGTSRGTREIARFPESVGSVVTLDGAVYASTRRSLWFVPSGGTKARRIARLNLDFRSRGVTFVKAGGRLLYEADLGDGVVDLSEIDTLHHRPRFLARFDDGFGPVAELHGGVILAAGSDPTDSRLYLWFLAPGARHPSLLSGCPEGCPSVEQASFFTGVLGGRVIFAGRDSRGSELWETDGTGPGTRLVKDLCPGECDGSPAGFTPALGRLIFRAGDRDLWVTDGTEGGTTRLGQIFSSVANGLDAAELNGRLIFNGIDEVHGSQPFVSDLTPAGTAPLVTLGNGLAAGASLQSLTPFGSGVLFGACSPGGFGLWHSDGTAAGTVPLAAVNPDCGSFSIGPIVSTGDLAFFSPDSAHLWRTDGTPEGTRVVASGSSVPLGALLPLSGGLFFITGPTTPQPPWFWDFWRIDGTSQGAVQTGEVELGGSPNPLGVVGGAVLFVSQRKESPFPDALWRTDGTTGGTQAIRDLFSSPEGFVPFNGKAALVMGTADRQAAGAELWVTDGTAAGTVPVIAGLNAPRPLNPRGLTVLEGDLYFFADTGDPARPVSLWRSDGTEAGTRVVTDFAPASDPSEFFPPAITAAGGFLFFRLDDGVHGEELWRSDGTAAGTFLLRDIAPGAAHSRPDSLTDGGGRLYFTATDGEHGLELWTSDGTAAGTVMVQDILPGPVSSWPQNLVTADGNLFFTAIDGEHGRELWALPLEP